MATAPWSSIPEQDTTFVLVTGANSGIGLGICERLIDTFLTTRSSSSHLVLIPTTRSARKSAETVDVLRRHLARAAKASAAASASSTPQDTIARVHISSVQVDLCDLTTVRRAAAQLVGGTLSFVGLGELTIPRLDAVIFNAGLGGWSGISWLGFARQILARGWIEATSRPTFQLATPGQTVDPLPGKAKDEAEREGGVPRPTLGLVFCANVFGHYLLAHLLLPLLSRKRDHADRPSSSPPSPPPGRVIWQSSVAPSLAHFSVDDLQGLRTKDAYESSKMLTDLLCLTADLPSACARSAPYFSSPSATSASAGAGAGEMRPDFFLAHPGIVATTILPVHFLLTWGYLIGVLISRWLGSPWFPARPYTAAVSTVWLALAPREELEHAVAGAEEAISPTRVKWGSATDIWGRALVKETEVDGWGWDGRVQTDDELRAADEGVAVRVLRRSVGRGLDARRTPMTEERRARFEEVGARCWDEMERLRVEWQGRLDFIPDA